MCLILAFVKKTMQASLPKEKTFQTCHSSASLEGFLSPDKLSYLDNQQTKSQI